VEDLDRSSDEQARLRRIRSARSCRRFDGLRAAPLPARFAALLVFFLFFFAGLFFGLTRSGNSALPVSRFHSSNCSGVISPRTSSSANLRRYALLLKGIHRDYVLGKSIRRESVRA
jgi:hypothetical protein